MNWLQSLDAGAFRWINHGLAHPGLDAVLPWLSGNSLFNPALLIAAFVLVWKGGARGRVCLVMLLLLAGALNNALVDVLKDWIQRPRPFADLTDARVLVGRGRNFSMPSGHAANWCAAAVLAWIYYRSSWWLLTPLAVLVCFSRVYNGVHYPGDVLAGMALGAGVGWGGVRALDALWQIVGGRWFPLWWRKLPSLRQPVVHPDPRACHPSGEILRDPAQTADRQWRVAGYLWIALVLGARLAYIASDTIELSKDEAYQWLWSRHLDWSYFSKPPMIACVQFAGRCLWGDTAFGVRFFSPVFAAIISTLLLRFLARETSARLAFVAILALTATPLTAAGSVLLTIDSPSVLFWTAAMLSGWKAIQPGGRTRDWAWTGLWVGLGFLSKYTALAQGASFALCFLFWPATRRHWRRPGPYVALAITALCLLPVLWWNSQNDWITVQHLQDRAGLSHQWQFRWAFLTEFTAAEFGLLNPVFFTGMLWAAAVVWRRRAQVGLPAFFLFMGAPLFLFYWLYTIRARVQPNWIAPTVVPLLCLAVLYWDARWRAGVRAVHGWLTAGLALGLVLIGLAHDTNLVPKLTGWELPPEVDPLRRVRGWKEAAEVLAGLRQELLQEGKPVFILGEHYGITSLFSFYLPEARAAMGGEALIYFPRTEYPKNQFYFWPSYQHRRGQNAIYVAENDTPATPPASLTQEFRQIEDLGIREIPYRGRVFHRLQFFVCRDLL